MAAETWAEQEQPILEAIRAAELDGLEEPQIAAAAKAAVPELREDLYTRSLFALHDDGYIEAFADRQAGVIMPIGLAPRGRRAVRQWPGDSLADTFLEEIERRANAAPDEDTRGRWRRLAAAAGDSGRDLLTEVLAAVVVRSAGL